MGVQLIYNVVLDSGDLSYWAVWVVWFICGCAGSSLLPAGFLWLCWVGFSLRWLPLLWSTGSRHTGCNHCSTWARELWFPGPRAQAQESLGLGLAVPRRADSSRTSNRTPVSCLGWHVLGHRAPSEALQKRFSYTYTYTYVPEKEVATHSSILAWRIPWTEEPGGL